MRNFQVFGRVELGSKMRESFATVEFVNDDIVVMAEIQSEGLENYGFLERVGADSLFPSIEKAIEIAEDNAFVTGIIEIPTLEIFQNRLYRYSYEDDTNYSITALNMANFIRNQRIKRETEIANYLLRKSL